MKTKFYENEAHHQKSNGGRYETREMPENDRKKTCRFWQYARNTVNFNTFFGNPCSLPCILPKSRKNRALYWQGFDRIAP